jgi:hypothetical protein
VFFVFFVALPAYAALGNYLVQDFSMDVGEPEIAARVAVREALMVETE